MVFICNQHLQDLAEIGHMNPNSFKKCAHCSLPGVVEHVGTFIRLRQPKRDKDDFNDVVSSSHERPSNKLSALPILEDLGVVGFTAATSDCSYRAEAYFPLKDRKYIPALGRLVKEVAEKVERDNPQKPSPIPQLRKKPKNNIPLEKYIDLFK